MNRLLALLILALGVVACQPEGQIYAEHQELSPGLEWLKKDIREFNIPIEDKSVSYTMRLSFRYLSGFEPQYVRVKVTEISPSGKEKVKEYELKVREDNGDYIGELAYEIWDSTHLIARNKKYNQTGLYTYLIEHDMPNDPLTNAMEIGVILEKAK